jgi:hypothetical protein
VNSKRDENTCHTKQKKRKGGKGEINLTKLARSDWVQCVKKRERREVNMHTRMCTQDLLHSTIGCLISVVQNCGLVLYKYGFKGKQFNINNGQVGDRQNVYPSSLSWDTYSVSY